MKILLIRFSSAGDVILTSLVLRCLRRRFPDAEIEYLTRREFAPLVEHSPYVNRVNEFDGGSGLAKLAGLRRELKRRAGGRYDLVFDLHDSLRSRLVRIGLGRQLEVIHKPTIRKRLLVRFKINKLRPIIPIPERYLMTAQRYGVENDGEGLDLFVGDTVSLLPPLPDTPTIALAPGARHFTKRWPADKWIELGRRILRDDATRVVLLGGPDERELCDSIAGAMADESDCERVISLAGHGSLLDAAATIDDCDVVISNDSALAHVAAARKRPVVAIFGSTVQEFGFAPYSPLARVEEVDGLYCRPCTTIGRTECPEGHFRCMREIEVERVKGEAGERMKYEG